MTMAYRRVQTWSAGGQSHPGPQSDARLYRTLGSPELCNTSPEHMDWADTSLDDGPYNLSSSSGHYLHNRLSDVGALPSSSGHYLQNRLSDVGTLPSSSGHYLHNRLSDVGALPSPPTMTSWRQNKKSPSSLLSMLNISESLSGMALPPCKSETPSYTRFPTFHANAPTSHVTKSSANGKSFQKAFSSLLDDSGDALTVHAVESSDEEESRSVRDAGTFQKRSSSVNGMNGHNGSDCGNNKDFISVNETSKLKAANGRSRKNCTFLLVTLSVLLLGIVLFQYFSDISPKCVDRIEVDALVQDLNSKVYGQHLAVDIISTALDGFLSPVKPDPTSLLVLLFHGWTGIGKNHVGNIISSYIPAGNVHKIIIPLHFPHMTDADSTKLREMFEREVLNGCGIQLFIIDEVDKADAGLIRSLHDVLIDLSLIRGRPHKSTFTLDNQDQRSVDDHHKTSSEPVSLSVWASILTWFGIEPTDIQSEITKVVVLLLSNTGGLDINSYMSSAAEAGRLRESISRHDIESHMNSSLAESWYQEFMEARLIDHVVPFLPLERRHVRGCVEAVFKARGVRDVDEQRIEAVLDQLTYFPKDQPLFSTAGCRKVPSQVDLLFG